MVRNSADAADGDSPGRQDRQGGPDVRGAAGAAPAARSPAHAVRIEYCTQCRWLPRAAWLAQELLGTFETELSEVALVPGTGGVFAVRVDGRLVWDRREQGFPDPSAVKRLVRDRVAPGRSLGHTDR